MKKTGIAPLCAALSVVALGWQLRAAVEDEPLTVAERSGFRATGRFAEVMDFLRAVAARSDVATLTTFGTSFEGRELPLLILADPPVRTPQEAKHSGKLVLFAFGAIHGGEVCGKEALQMLARDVALHPDAPANRKLLDRAVVLLAPLYNADGNERMSPDNRPGQNGPVEGMGQRANAQGLDLNRDWMKLEAPETRAMVGLLNQWKPHLVIDTHTTNGSFHRFALTYAAPQNPSGPAGPIEYVRDAMLPRVSQRVLAQTGYRTFFYGNFNRDRTQWRTYSSQPRFGCPYRGLRGRMSILTEAYAYASFEDRVRATLAFVRACFDDAVERAKTVRRIVDEAERETIARGEDPSPDDLVGIQHRIAAFDKPVTIPGFVEKAPSPGARPLPTSELRDYVVQHYGRFEPVVSVPRPWGYLIPPGLDAVVEKLEQHGVVVEPVGPLRDVMAQETRIDRVRFAERVFQGHREAFVEATLLEPALRRITSSWRLVRTAQPLGTLAVYLLEPESDDGLVRWNFLDEHLREGGRYPILRLPAKPADWPGP